MFITSTGMVLRNQVPEHKLTKHINSTELEHSHMYSIDLVQLVQILQACKQTRC